MDKTHRDSLQKNHSLLLSEVTYEEISAHLVSGGVLSPDKNEELEEFRGNRKKMTALLTYLPRQGPEAFDIFIEALKQENKKHVIKALIGDTKQLVEELSDFEHQNWNKGQHALSKVKEGIKQWTMDTSKVFHDLLINKHGLEPCKDKCHESSQKQNKPCGNCVYCAWKTEIKNYSVNEGSGLCFQNAVARDWYTYHWEVAKVYMSALGKNAAQISGAEDCDTSALIQLISRNKFFVQRYESGQYTLRGLKNVLDQRNKLMHSADKKLTSEQLNELIDVCIAVITNPVLGPTAAQLKPELDKLKHMPVPELDGAMSKLSLGK